MVPGSRSFPLSICHPQKVASWCKVAAIKSAFQPGEGIPCPSTLRNLEGSHTSAVSLWSNVITWPLLTVKEAGKYSPLERCCHKKSGRLLTRVNNSVWPPVRSAPMREKITEGPLGWDQQTEAFWCPGGG